MVTTAKFPTGIVRFESNLKASQVRRSLVSVLQALLVQACMGIRALEALVVMVDKICLTPVNQVQRTCSFG